MSSDDEEFVYEVIQRAEKFMASEVAKVRKDLLDYKADRDKRLNALEEEITHLKRVQTGNEQTMEDLRNENEQLRQQIESVAAERLETTLQPARMIENAFRAGLSSVKGERTTSIDITPVLDAIGATPTTSTPMPERTCQLMTNTLKRKNPPEESPSAFTRLEDIPESTRRVLEPYYMVDGQANKDKLNKVQRAFIKLKTNQLVRDKTSNNILFAQKVIQEGIEERIWSSEFSPSSEVGFPQYIMHRVKNEKKSMSKRQLLANQNERMNAYIDEALSVGRVDE